MAAKIQNWRKNILACDTETVRPVSTLPTDSETQHPIVFEIRNHGEHIIDVSNIRLNVLFRVHKGTAGAWANLEATDMVTLLNQPLTSIFSDANIYVNNELVETANMNFQQ
jgi:hypothetical protein